jgi:hypothetical protein
LEVNFLNFLNFRGTRKSRKITGDQARSSMSAVMARRGLSANPTPTVALTPNRHHATPKGHPAPGTRPVEPGEGERTRIIIGNDAPDDEIACRRQPI